MGWASGRRLQARGRDGLPAAGRRLLDTYQVLARNGEHLLQSVLNGAAPRHWSHYPDDDAIDYTSGYQWFYHSHSPEDRPGAAEHGHIHLFAGRQLWNGRLRSQAERDFAAMTGRPRRRVRTRHLLGIGLDAKGVPISLFTVNSWVTGDLMLSAWLTEQLLEHLQLATAYPRIDAVLESVTTLYRAEIGRLLAFRDAALRTRTPAEVLDDRSLEVLSEIPIDLDRKLADA